jgi:hypothetical protein
LSSSATRRISARGRLDAAADFVDRPEVFGAAPAMIFLKKC